MRMFAPLVSTRNAEWPYQVSFINVSSIFSSPEDRTPSPKLKCYTALARQKGQTALFAEGKPVGIITIEELPARLGGGRTLAGLDLGDKTIGVAVSDRNLA